MKIRRMGALLAAGGLAAVLLVVGGFRMQNTNAGKAGGSARNATAADMTSSSISILNWGAGRFI